MVSNDYIKHESRAVCYLCTLSVLECFRPPIANAVVINKLNSNQINIGRIKMKSARDILSDVLVQRRPRAVIDT